MSDSLWLRRDEILELLKKWAKSYAVIRDEIPPSFIKSVAQDIAGPLEITLNLRLMRVEVPSKWKETCLKEAMAPKRKPE